MMKPIFPVLSLLLFLCVMLAWTGCAKDEYTNPNEIPLSELPAKAGYFLLDLFPDQKPVLVEKAGEEEDSYSFRATYPDDVTISFDNNGTWKRIDLPSEPLPGGIRNYFPEMVHYANTAYQLNCIQSITRTDYGQFATLDNGITAAFSDDIYLGEELGKEGYEELPKAVRSFLAMYFPDVACKYVTIDRQPGIETAIYKYRVSLDNGCKAWFSPDGSWKYITSVSNEQRDVSLPLTLIGILPQKIQRELGSVTELYMLYKRGGTFYDVGLSPFGKNTYDATEVPPTDLHQKEVKEFIAAYFDTDSGYSLTVPIQTANPHYYVRLPNGFDFRLNSSLQWDQIDGHGYPFNEKLLALVPAKILADSRVKKYITAIRRDETGYYVNLIGNYYLQYDTDGNYIGQYSPTAYDKAYTYVRYTYPKDFSIQYMEWEGLVFKLNDGTKLTFDSEGKLVE